MFFFFNDTATTEIYTLSLHDALPISARVRAVGPPAPPQRDGLLAAVEADRSRRRRGVLRRRRGGPVLAVHEQGDRKSTRLNSSHANISYAVFCLKKKNNKLFSTHHQL